MIFLIKMSLFLSVLFCYSTAYSGPESDPKTLDVVLKLAVDDSKSLIQTGTVCEEVGVSSSHRRIQCGILGIRQIEGKDFWTTRCFVLCNNGYFEQGNFCQIEAVDRPTSEHIYCDR